MTWITVFNAFVIVYFAILNAVYITLMVIAFRRLRRYVDRIHSLDIDGLVASSGGLPISLITPAFNEEATIVQSVRSLLTLRYAEYEIVVVNDGSTDGTLDRLIDAYDLHPVERVPTASIATESVADVYGSDRHPTLFVVDKDNGGKADALNAGLNYARGSVFCALDGDTLLEPDSLARMVRPFLEDATTVAVGGIIRIVNGCDVESGAVEDVALPQGLLPRFQVLEYLRAFLATRVGWDAVGSTLIISGAFGAFRRSTVGAAGGFDTETVGEDMELVVRLHRHCRETGTPYRVVFIPDPVAWTEVPESLSQLARQRDRWQRGLAHFKPGDLVARARPGAVAPQGDARQEQVRSSRDGRPPLPAHLRTDQPDRGVDGVGHPHPGCDPGRDLTAVRRGVPLARRLHGLGPVDHRRCSRGALVPPLSTAERPAHLAHDRPH